MLRSKEIMVLLALLVVGAALVLWYVIDRRAKNRAGPPPSAVMAPALPVDLAKNERQTIDFSSGQPVVKDRPEDKVAIDAAVKDMAEATKDVTFAAPRKKVEPPAAPPKR
jgi:hypothetical protein